MPHGHGHKRGCRCGFCRGTGRKRRTTKRRKTTRRKSRR